MKNNNSQTGKKYKLIKKYPGSPKLGTVINSRKSILGEIYYSVNLDCMNSIDFDAELIENDPEYWQEVVEQRYEILSFKNTEFNSVFMLKLTNGLFKSTYSPANIQFSENDLLKSGDHMVIHSVKRLSDGEIFTVGDRISSHNMEKNIKAIRVINGLSQELEFTTVFDNIRSTGFQYLFADNVQKVRKPLLVTMDGAYVFEGDKIWRLNGLYEVLEPIEAKSHHAKWSEDWFSTKKVAQNYALMNKPCMSVNDIISQTEDAMSRTQSKLIEIAKSKL